MATKTTQKQPAEIMPNIPASATKALEARLIQKAYQTTSYAELRLQLDGALAQRQLGLHHMSYLNVRDAIRARMGDELCQ